MAQLKAGSTTGGITIKSTTGPWTSSDMDFSAGVGLTEGYIKKAITDEFELVATSGSNVKAPAQGVVAGFTSGGLTPTVVATIDKFPFTAPFTTAASAGSLSQARYIAARQSSSTEGFTSGGTTPTTAVTTINKFPFTAPFTTATSAGNLSQAR